MQDYAELDTDHVTGVFKNSCIAIWRGATTATAVSKFEALQRTHAVAQPEKLIILQVVEATASPPSTEVRAALGAMLQRASEYTVASAVAFEGDGLRASVVRSIVTGLNLMSQPSYPHKIFKTVREAIAWQIQVPGAAPIRAENYYKAIEELREKLSAGTAEGLQAV